MLLQEVGENGQNYGAYGNTFTLEEEEEEEKPMYNGAKPQVQEVVVAEEEEEDESDGGKKKVIRGYLKNPFGSDFIRLEVDEDRLKHNKTAGVVHVPLVVVDKAAMQKGAVVAAPPPHGPTRSGQQL